MPRNKIFVDTSAWCAFIDKNDRDHPAAMNKVKVLDRSLLTSNYVLDEIDIRRGCGGRPILLDGMPELRREGNL